MRIVVERCLNLIARFGFGFNCRNTDQPDDVPQRIDDAIGRVVLGKRKVDESRWAGDGADFEPFESHVKHLVTKVLGNEPDSRHKPFKNL